MILISNCVKMFSYKSFEECLVSNIETVYDPKSYIESLQQILSSDKKRIAFLFGSGTSFCKKKTLPTIPDMRNMTKQFEEHLSKKEKFKKAIELIKKELGEKYNIETFLSCIEQKKEVIGEGKLNNLSSQDFDSLIKETKKYIKEKVSIHIQIEQDSQVNQLIHSDFAQWVGCANKKHPIEIFTTNYDYLFEIGFEYKDIPYYDGFAGSYNPFFNSNTVNDLGFLPNQTKLWKLHGSLGWKYEESTNKIIRSRNINEDSMLIYPSILKYNNSKKMPYTAFTDRLANFLRQPDTLLITCGYSFSDEHINELILSSLKVEKSGDVIALYYDIGQTTNGQKKYNFTKNSNMANLAMKDRKLSVYACQSAVIGGHYGKWQLKMQPDKNNILNINLYFDEDATVGDSKWTGKGELRLPDFLKFVEFLQSMIMPTHLKK